jgi:hypothetical protein
LERFRFINSPVGEAKMALICSRSPATFWPFRKAAAQDTLTRLTSGEAFGMWNSGPIGCGICIQVCPTIVLRFARTEVPAIAPVIASLLLPIRVADACAAARFFRTEYKLDKVFFWGLCMGGAVAVHASARLSGPFKPAA